MNLDRRLLEWAGPARAFLAGAAAAGFAGGMAAIAQAWLLSSIIAAVFLQGRDLAGVMIWMWMLLGVFLARATAAWAQEACGARGSARVRQALRRRLVEQIRRRGPAGLQSGSTGELTAVLLQGVDALDAFYSQYLPQVALAALIPISILAVVFPLDLLSGLIFLLTAPLIPLFMIWIGRSAEAVTRKQFTTLGRMSAYFLDTLLGLTTLKQLNQSQSRLATIARVSQDYRVKTMQVLRLTFLSALALELAATISTAVVAVEIALRLLSGAIEFQPAFFILILAPEFYLPLRLLGQRFHSGAAAGASAARIHELLAAPSHLSPAELDPTVSIISAPVAASASPVAARPPVALGSFVAGRLQTIRFDQVGFHYPGRAQPALAGIDLELRAGELTALVGESGSGKTTLAFLLLGFLRAQEGHIWVDGIDLATLPLAEWRNQLAYVPQQPYLFQDSLAGNIRLARPKASLDEVRRAARLAGLDDFVSGLPRGYDTPAGESGARLSSGQIQRVALARAFLKDAPVLILDEPASRLDPELEQELAEATIRLCQGRIGLVIAHRAASVRRAAKVVVLRQGKVVEAGALHELLARGGAFSALMAGAR